MKIKALTLIFAAAFSLASCGEKKEENTNEGAAAKSTEEIDNTAVANDTLTPNDVDTEAPVTVTVNGRVNDITMGKDGYTAHITDDSGRDYYATISRVNLEDPAQYKDIKVGDKITVKGESFKLEDKLHIKVHELK